MDTRYKTIVEYRDEKDNLIKEELWRLKSQYKVLRSNIKIERRYNEKRKEQEIIKRITKIVRKTNETLF